MCQTRAVLCVLLLGVATLQLTEGLEKCVIDCSSGQQYWPHPTNCEMFVQCAPYGPQEMPCAEGTRWDQSILTCGHEDATPCVTGNYVDESGNACEGVNSNGGNGGSGNGGSGNQGNINWPSGSVDGCVIDCSSGQHYWQHPSNCEMFVQCAPYGPQEMPCAEGTRWDQNILTCGHKESTPCVTSCGAGNDDGEDGDEGSGNDGTGNDGNDNGGDGSEGSGSDGNGNGGNGGENHWLSGTVDGCIINCGSDQTYVKHPRDCSKFIQCSIHGPQEMMCAPGTLWNQKLLTCTKQDETKCEFGIYVDEDGDQCPSPRCNGHQCGPGK